MFRGNKMRICYLCSMVMLVIFSATFLTMPVTDMYQFQNPRIVLVIVGLAFWISGIAGYTFLVLAYRLTQKGQGKKEPGKKKIYFFSNIPTMIADSVFVLGVIAFMVLSWRNMTGRYVAYVDIFLIVLAFNMHLLCSRGLYRAMKE